MHRSSSYNVSHSIRNSLPRNTTQPHKSIAALASPRSQHSIIALSVRAAYPRPPPPHSTHRGFAGTRLIARAPKPPLHAFSASLRRVEPLVAHARSVARPAVLAVSVLIAALAGRAGFPEEPRFALRAVGIRGEPRAAHAGPVARQPVRAFAVVAVAAGTAVGPVKPVQTLLAVLQRVASLAAVRTHVSRTDELDRQLRGVRAQLQRAVEHHRHEILALVAVLRVASVDRHVHLQRTRLRGRFARPIETRGRRVRVDRDEHRSTIGETWKRRQRAEIGGGFGGGERDGGVLGGVEEDVRLHDVSIRRQRAFDRIARRQQERSHRHAALEHPRRNALRADGDEQKTPDRMPVDRDGNERLVEEGFRVLHHGRIRDVQQFRGFGVAIEHGEREAHGSIRIPRVRYLRKPKIHLRDGAQIVAGDPHRVVRNRGTSGRFHGHGLVVRGAENRGCVEETHGDVEITWRSGGKRAGRERTHAEIKRPAQLEHRAIRGNVETEGVGPGGGVRRGLDESGSEGLEREKKEEEKPDH